MNNEKIMSKIIASSLVFVIGAVNVSEVFAYTKDETVYSKVKSNGENYQTTVTEHIKNTDDINTLNDISELLNITNTNGDEKFSKENNSITWNAYGNDIYYKGNTEKEIPIETSINYELDGKEIEAKDLAGKSGKIKITINYTNKEERTVTVNGKTEKMYVPFVIATGTIFDNTKIKNIKITNGRVVDNGTKTFVVALSCPGLVESLELKDDLDIDLNKVEITFDAENFEIGNIMSVAMPKVFENTDIDNLDALDEIYSQINELKSASNQLVEGAKTLQDGTEEYIEKSSEFAEGLSTFNRGMNTATNSYDKIDEGIDSVNSNVDTLKNGASKINDGVNDLTDGLNTLQSGVSAGKKQAVSSLETSSKTLDAGIDQIIDGKDVEIDTIKEKVIENANDQLATGLKTGISTSVSSAIDTTMNAKIKSIMNDESLTEEEKVLLQKVLPKMSITEAEKQAMSKQIGTAIDNAIETTTKAQEAGLDTINNSEKGVKAGLNTLKSQATSSIEKGISAISSGFDSITDGTEKLIDGSNELKSGTTSLENGTSQLQAGVNTLASGSKDLKSGLNTLNSSSNKLNNANMQLLEGANTISDGAKTLADGMTTFDKDGIDKLVSYVNGDIKDLQVRIEKLQELANEYDSFAGIAEGNEGTTKFIFLVDSIKNETKEENQSTMPINNEENLSKSDNYNKETISGE